MPMLPNGHDEFLTATSLVAGYGKRRVLDGVSLAVGRGEIMALIGHNGAGKSTLLKAFFGLLPIWEGELVFDGNRVRAPTPYRMKRMGVSYVPQGNRVFGDLTIYENLQVGAFTLRDNTRLKDRIDHALSLFPALQKKLRQRAYTLSGGEKQMLTLATALVLSPRALLVDEPSLGLAPHLVAEALGHISQISRELGTTVLVVEQKVRDVLKIAGRVCVLRNGRISFLGASDELLDEARLRDVYM